MLESIHPVEGVRLHRCACKPLSWLIASREPKKGLQWRVIRWNPFLSAAIWNNSIAVQKKRARANPARFFYRQPSKALILAGWSRSLVIGLGVFLDGAAGGRSSGSGLGRDGILRVFAGSGIGGGSGLGGGRGGRAGGGVVGESRGGNNEAESGDQSESLGQGLILLEING